MYFETLKINCEGVELGLLLGGLIVMLDTTPFFHSENEHYQLCKLVMYFSFCFLVVCMLGKLFAKYAILLTILFLSFVVFYLCIYILHFFNVSAMSAVWSSFIEHLHSFTCIMYVVIKKIALFQTVEKFVIVPLSKNKVFTSMQKKSLLFLLLAVSCVSYVLYINTHEPLMHIVNEHTETILFVSSVYFYVDILIDYIIFLPIVVKQGKIMT